MIMAEAAMIFIVRFGKYQGQPLSVMLGDFAYCRWLLTQPWFDEAARRARPGAGVLA